MSDSIRNNSRLTNNWKKGFERRKMQHHLWFKKISGENTEKKTMMEMWDNYLLFTRLEF